MVEGNGRLIIIMAPRSEGSAPQNDARAPQGTIGKLRSRGLSRRRAYFEIEFKYTLSVTPLLDTTIVQNNCCFSLLDDRALLQLAEPTRTALMHNP